MPEDKRCQGVNAMGMECFKNGFNINALEFRISGLFGLSTDPDGFNVTARIRADSWIQGLRNGLSKLGDTADVRNVMCDITEDGIDVTEPASGRVFRIRELPDEVAAAPAAAPPVQRLTGDTDRSTSKPSSSARLGARVVIRFGRRQRTRGARLPTGTRKRSRTAWMRGRMVRAA